MFAQEAYSVYAEGAGTGDDSGASAPEVAPSWVSQWVQSYQPTPTPTPSGGGGGGILSSIGSVLSSVVSGAAQVGAAYLQTQKPTTTGTTLITSGGAARPIAAGIVAAPTPISSLTSYLPILAILGIGALLVLRGKKK